jgi:hypothetical protein
MAKRRLTDQEIIGADQALESPVGLHPLENATQRDRLVLLTNDAYVRDFRSKLAFLVDRHMNGKVL